MIEKPQRAPGVFAGNHIGLLERLDRPQGHIGEISKGRGDNIERAVRPMLVHKIRVRPAGRPAIFRCDARWSECLRARDDLERVKKDRPIWDQTEYRLGAGARQWPRLWGWLCDRCGQT